MNRDDLPIKVQTKRTEVVLATQDHIAQLYKWPSYPKYFEYYNMTDRFALSSSGKYWWEDIDDLNRFYYMERKK